MNRVKLRGYLFRGRAECTEPGYSSAFGRIFCAGYSIGVSGSEVKIPIHTALLAAFFPSHSERLSVIRKVAAKSTFPSGCSVPKALIMINTFMFARTVAMAERQ